MLKLKDITKDYVTPDVTVEAVRGISLDFRKSEFVSILGPSGCGKTTMLNIIGGLDRYTTGDLYINGKSTKDFKDSDWDAYRNNSIGFVFQSYNLIPHQTVLGNVELALTLSGVSKEERKNRSIEALERVGLGDQLYKKPNQLSGGQMQRVAIARAIVNNPDILLADEPTGALDSKTSVQIMDILKELSKDKLVIMVTHNADLAHEYSTRVIELLDGKVVSDSDPYQSQNVKEEKKKDKKAEKQERKEQNKKEKKKKEPRLKTSMNFFTALHLSLQNLISKKGRTFLTALAGSIGIIGIALVLSLSNGFTNYINKLQSDTLSGFPLIVADLAYMTDINYRTYYDSNNKFIDEEIVIPRDYSDAVHINKIDQDYLDYLEGMDKEWYNSVLYERVLGFNVVGQNYQSGEYFTINTSIDTSNPSSAVRPFAEMIDNREFVESQYDILKGRMPENKNELVLVVDQFNQISSRVFSALGIDYKALEDDITFDDFLNMEFKLLLNDDFYTYYEPLGLYTSLLKQPEELFHHDNAVPLNIVGILRIKPEVPVALMTDGVLYTNDLTSFVLEHAVKSEVALAQKEAGMTKNVLTGDPFTPESAMVEYQFMMSYLGATTRPNGIKIFPKDFESKELIKDYLRDYNEGKEEVDQVIFNDLSELISKSMNTLINSISTVLIAFAAISLVVSSIMIGIITYVSVIERTKEIGVLRSIGARKRDISRVFNAETFIIGLTAGMLGVLIGLVLTIPLNNIIIKYLGNIGNLAVLNLLHGGLLVIISVVLTLISGLIPSRMAANKDPVVALRSE